ncbi:MAG: hypothetical protein ACM3MK_10380 [Chitinophagales bacterium]
MEKSKEFKIGMALASFALTLALALGGFHLYKQHVINEPLIETLGQLPGVEGVKIDNQQDPLTIQLTLTRTDDLKDTYFKAESLVKKQLKSKPYVLEIKGNSTTEMENEYQDLELAVYQGIANNSFIWLDGIIDRSSQTHEYKYRLQVDEDNLYITMKKGGHYLCRVVPRKSDSIPVSQGVAAS